MVLGSSEGCQWFQAVSAWSLVAPSTGLLEYQSLQVQAVVKQEVHDIDGPPVTGTPVGSKTAVGHALLMDIW